MSGGFHLSELEQRYAFLDALPERLLPRLVTLPDGTLTERAAGVRLWRDSLLDGRLPPTGADWPPAAVAAPVLRALDELGVVRFCKGQPELVDALLESILSAFVRQADALRVEVAERLRELERLERVAAEEREKLERAWNKRKPPPVRLNPDVRRRLGEQAEREAATRDRGADAALVAAWSRRVRAWTKVAEVFGDLAAVLGRGWDMAPGVLHHTGWTNLVRLQALLRELPRLRQMIQALGRLHAAPDGSCVAEQVFAPVRRLEQVRREVRTPMVHSETRGVERSGEISRMLPVEAAMLGHPALRLLWHARRAERALLTYYVEGVAAEQEWAEAEMEDSPERLPPRQRGPIVAVIDTSGSMEGLPERVAKALVLEAMRTAHAEKRRCLLYAYGAPGEIVEHELDLADGGTGRLLDFLALSFGGGSDEMGVMSRVVARLEEEHWKNADVVFVSDGEWPVPAELHATVLRAREGGTRFHGVQIGNRGATGLASLCDPVHVFQDWAAAGGWDGSAPAGLA